MFCNSKKEWQELLDHRAQTGAGFRSHLGIYLPDKINSPAFGLGVPIEWFYLLDEIMPGATLLLNNVGHPLARAGYACPCCWYYR